MFLHFVKILFLLEALPSIAVVGFAHAATAETQLAHIGLLSVIQEAIDRSPDLQSLKYEALAKHAEIGPAGSYEDPMFSFGLLNYPIDTLSPRQLGMTGNELMLTQKIPFPGKLTKNRNAVSEEYEARSKDFENSELELIRSVKMAYYDWYLADRKSAILREQKKVIDQMITAMRNRFALGQAAQAEVINFQVEEAALIDQLLTSETQVSTRLLELSRLAGRADTPFQGVPDEIKVTEIHPENMSFESLRERALRKNPAYQAAVHENAARSESLTRARLGYLPDFELSAAYMIRQPNLDDRGTDLVSGKIALTLPIWFLSKQSEEVRGASAEQSRTEARLTREGQALLARVDTGYHELLEAKRRLDLYGGGYLALARQAVLSAKPAYLARKLDYSTLLSAINNRFKTESGYYEAVVGFESKVAELESLIGEPLEASGK